MTDVIRQLRDAINYIYDFLNHLQQNVIGLITNTDNVTIYGKLNNISDQINNIQVPIYTVERLTITGNQFTTTHAPINGVCVNDEVTITFPDTSTILYEGIDFVSTTGTLTDAANEYNGYEVKVSYFYY